MPYKERNREDSVCFSDIITSAFRSKTEREAIKQTSRANHAALELTGLMLQIPYLPDGLIRRFTYMAPPHISVSVHLYDNHNAHTVKQLLANRDYNTRISLHNTKSDESGLTEYSIEWRPSARGLSYFKKEVQHNSVFTINTHRYTNEYFAKKGNTDIDFSPELRAQVYHDVADIFELSRDAIMQKMPNLRQRLQAK